MHDKNEDLHGMAPDKASVVLLLIDVINNLEFEGSEQLLEHALPMARRIADLKTRANELASPPFTSTTTTGVGSPTSTS